MRSHQLAPGERVRDRRRLSTRLGTVATSPVPVPAGRSCEVQWDDGARERRLTKDLKRPPQVAQAPCDHHYEEQPGEPPVDVCTRCGDRQY